MLEVVPIDPDRHKLMHAASMALSRTNEEISS